MTERSIAYRLGVTGKEDVQRALTDIGDSGDASAKRLGAQFERQAAIAEAAIERANRAAAKIAAIAPQTPVQMRINDANSTGYGQYEGSARTSAAAIKALLDEQDEQAKRADLLRQKLDPLYAAQKRYDGEIAEATKLLSAGAISQKLYDQQVALSEKALNAAKRAADKHAGALGLNRAQYITAQSAVLRFTDSIIAGRNPLTAFALEAHKGVEVLSLDDDGLAGGLKKVASFVTPATLAIAALGTATLVAAAAAIEYSVQLDKLSRVADGLGRTSELSGQQLADIAARASEAGNVSIRAAEDIEIAVLRHTRASGEALDGVVRIAQRFGDALGIDAAKAADELGKALAAPAKGADELAAKYGFLTEAQVEEIHQLMEQNRLFDAQKALLSGVDGSLDKTGEHVNALTNAWRVMVSVFSNGLTQIGHDIDRLLGLQNKAERAVDLKTVIDQQLRLPSFLRIPEAQLRSYQTEYAQIAADLDRVDNSARKNQLAQETRAIAAQYGINPKIQPKLEDLKAQLATALQSRDAGNSEDATIEALQRAVRTYLTPEQKRIAIQTAQADLRRAAPHSKAREDAAERLKNAQTAGEVLTEQGADALAQERGLAALGHGRTGGGREETLKREAAAMEVAASSSIKLAEAYLAGGDAAVKAEAARKGAVDATKKGIDQQAQIQRQLNVDIAEATANGAKSVYQLREETAARAAIDAQVASGKLSVDDMNKALSDEAALRPLLKLQASAQGTALAELTKVIEAYRAALKSAHDEEAHSNFLTAIDQINTAIKESKAAIAELTRDPATQTLDAARRAAERDADKQHYQGADRDQFIQGRVDQARQQLDERGARYATDTLRNQRLSIEYVDRELQLVRSGEDVRSRELPNLRLKQQLLEQYPDLAQAEVNQIIKGNDDLERRNELLAKAQRDWDEAQQSGRKFVEDVLDPRNWTSFGDVAKRVLKDIADELIKLALINPLENKLFGGNAPGLGGVLGWLFGGGGGKGADSFRDVIDFKSLPSVIPKFAAGTDSAPGGLALVGEEGPELAFLPRGAQVRTAGETRKLLAGSGAPVLHMPVNIYAPGADAAALARVEQKLDEHLRTYQQKAISAFINAKQRRVIR